MEWLSLFFMCVIAWAAVARSSQPIVPIIYLNIENAHSTPSAPPTNNFEEITKEVTKTMDQWREEARRKKQMFADTEMDRSIIVE